MDGFQASAGTAHCLPRRGGCGEKIHRPDQGMRHHMCSCEHSVGSPVSPEVPFRAILFVVRAPSSHCGKMT
eukprot:9816059-Heterocapsa_arctica.AAC.1